jgi:hypothetical protein
MSKLGNREFNFEVQEVVRKENHILTKRDLEIIVFCLEMKFSTIEQLHAKFFKVLNEEGISLSDRWARERISKLKKFGYLKDQKVYSTGKNLILATQKGYFVANIDPKFDNLPRPLSSVDFRQFDHDRSVTDCRLLLEDSKKVTSWLSERSMQSAPIFKEAFGEETVADGLYIDSSGGATFFELDLTQKSKDRYKRKIRKYVNLLRSNSAAFGELKRVHFVCAKESILRAIKKECEIFGELFMVESISDFRASVERGGLNESA